MNAARFHLGLALIGMIMPFVFFFYGLKTVNWDIQTALADFQIFYRSFFGEVVLLWLFISGCSLSAFVIYESMVRRDYYLLWTLLVICIFSVGAALPFYLYLRSPKRDQ